MTSVKNLQFRILTLAWFMRTLFMDRTMYLYIPKCNIFYMQRKLCRFCQRGKKFLKPFVHLRYVRVKNLI